MTRASTNPFRPGAGHQPPYLAGRTEELREFDKLLEQEIVMHNMILTGLRGVGKTVLLESFKPRAQSAGWLWAGTDFSESASVNENTMAIRLLTDIALITSNIKFTLPKESLGFSSEQNNDDIYLNFSFLTQHYLSTPGLPADKLKATMTLVWKAMTPLGSKGIVFAYDEAQTLSDHAEEKQFPLSLLLDVFQYLQKTNVPFMLVLTGLPTLLSRLIETRTYTERLFRVLVLGQLNEQESREAITKPIDDAKHPVKFDAASVDLIVRQSGGYPYFIQFMCREIYDIFEQLQPGSTSMKIPIDAIIQKLDNDFFAGRWSKATEREKELLTVIARNATGEEFGVQQVVELSNASGLKPFSKSQVSQMLSRLIENGLVYKNRRGSYSFAVPLLEGYILRIAYTNTDHSKS